jgi:hypothetical protein
LTLPGLEPRLLSRLARSHSLYRLRYPGVKKTSSVNIDGRPKRNWEDNIKADLDEIEWEFVDRIHLATDKIRWLAVVKYGNEPSGSFKARVFVSS